MNILIIGNGGREHALAWKMKQSKLCDNLYVAPGNGGTGMVAENVPIAVDDFLALGEFCIKSKIELVVVGPEAPLVKGIRDYFESNPFLAKILMVGPGKAGAQLEGSKDFSKQFMLRHKIPTAKAKTFNVSELKLAIEYIGTCKPPIVLKADGLAAGKGVIISLSQGEAKAVIKDMLVNKKFGEASAKVLIEEFLNGIELSVFVLTDGKDYIILPEAKDYKRIGEGDTGPNTGGMGAVSPVIFATKEFMHKVEEQVVKPTIEGLKNEAIPFKGFVFIGIMNVGGNPYVIEYNVRLGDPETQVVMPRVKNDLVELFIATAKGELRGTQVEIADQSAVAIVAVAEGYPEEYKRGDVISGLENKNDALLFQAGTKKHDDNVVTDGGRVLTVTGLGANLADARRQAFAGISKIQWQGLYFRNDIGLDLINLNQK